MVQRVVTRCLQRPHPKRSPSLRSSWSAIRRLCNTVTRPSTSPAPARPLHLAVIRSRSPTATTYRASGGLTSPRSRPPPFLPPPSSTAARRSLPARDPSNRPRAPAARLHHSLACARPRRIVPQPHKGPQKAAKLPVQLPIAYIPTAASASTSTSTSLSTRPSTAAAQLPAPGAPSWRTPPHRRAQPPPAAAPLARPSPMRRLSRCQACAAAC